MIEMTRAVPGRVGIGSGGTCPPSTRHRRGGVWRVPFLAAAVGLLGASAPASAFTLPIHGEAVVHTYGGQDAGADATGVDTDAGPGPLLARAGTQWWCDIPGCSVGLGPEAGLGWGRVTADPAAGLIRTRAGAYNATSDRVRWTIAVPWLPGGTLQVDPGYWGEATTETYLRSTWRIMADDTGPSVGDPVQLRAAFRLDGAIETGEVTRIEAGLLLNTAAMANAHWLADRESITVHDFGELVQPIEDVGWLAFSALEAGPVDHEDSLIRTFAVGDVVVMETLLRAFAGVRNQGIPREVWVDLDQTLQSDLVALTPGVILVPVPEPATWATLAAGLGLVGGLAWRARRR